MSWRLPAVLAAAGMVAACSVLGPAPPPGPGAGPAPPPWRTGRAPGPPARWAEQGEWAIADDCASCHRVIVRDLAATPHGPLLAEEGDGWGCDACHGPGWEHSDTKAPEDIDRPQLLPAAEVGALCGRCHFETLRALEAAGRHREAAGRSCTGCHRIHPPQEEKQEGEEPAPAPGIAACADCHPDAVAGHLASGHGSWFTRAGIAACTSCHGEALAAHAAAPEESSPELRRGPALEAACADCHERQGPRWRGTAHRAAGLGCLDCHQPFDDGAARAAGRCLDCHQESLDDFRLPFHHPLEEGGTSCADCHPVHDDGGRGVFTARRMARRCEECHLRETGPFVFSHEAGRLDGCSACHEDHGSVNPKLLRMWPVRDLCLSCHPVTPASHDQRAFSPFRECVSCHVEVHGSDLDRRYFR